MIIVTERWGVAYSYSNGKFYINGHEVTDTVWLQRISEVIERAEEQADKWHELYIDSLSSN